MYTIKPKTQEAKVQIELQNSLPEKQTTEDGQELSRLSCFMTTPANEHLYPNLSYFMGLANSGEGLWSYFRSKGEELDDDYDGDNGEPAPCTWGIDMDEIYGPTHKANPKGLIPTYHELDVIKSVFGNKLYGTYQCYDTRICEKNPPLVSIEFVWDDQPTRKKIKLPPKWHAKLNEKVNKYYYWNETDRKAQWGHPWPRMMESLEGKVDLFRDISDNYERSIHAHMNMKGEDFYELLGIQTVIKRK